MFVSEDRRSAQIQIGSIESREVCPFFGKVCGKLSPIWQYLLNFIIARKKVCANDRYSRAHILWMDRYVHTGERSDNAFYLPTRNFTITQIGFHCFFIWLCACESSQTICCRNGTERKEINMPQSTSRVRNKLSWWLLCHHLHCAQFHFGKADERGAKKSYSICSYWIWMFRIRLAWRRASSNQMDVK